MVTLAGARDTAGVAPSPSSPTDLAAGGTLQSTSDGAIITIAAQGDLVLQIAHGADPTPATCRFRVSAATLRSSSTYFDRLLQPGRFGEGEHVEARHKSLRERYPGLAGVPAGELPVVAVADLGRTSPLKAAAALCADFLKLVHGQDLPSAPPVANLANLAVVADRFGTLEAVKGYLRRKKVLREIDGKITAKADAVLSEEKVRQRVLVAVLLDYPPWTDRYSARLVTKGWVGKEIETSAALWWDLPSRIEEELAYRREGVLETLVSLQSYFITLYTSRERQCKLGYDSSGQCDSFQLGEMVRFFTRIGTLQFRGLVFDTSEPHAPFDGDVYALLDKLRQVPEYQIDKNHTHCGIRTRLVPLLDLIQDCLNHIGICPECWSDDRMQYAWLDAKRPLLWKKQDFRLRAQGHNNRHADIKAMFTATERDWS